MAKTPAPTLPELLKPFRDTEATMAHTAIVLTGQADLMRLCSAWTTMLPKWSKPAGAPPIEESPRWDWIWSGVWFDQAVLARRAGMLAHRVLERFEILRANRLVYPDGTIANVAKLLMRTAVAKASGASARKKKENDSDG